MLKIDLRRLHRDILQDTSRQASIRSATAPEPTNSLIDEMVLGEEDPDVQHDSAFTGDEYSKKEEGISLTADVFSFLVDKKELLKRIKAEADTKAAILKRPELSINYYDTVDDSQEESPEDISLTEEEKKSIKSNVQSITDKRAAILSKEKGLEFSDYTFVSEQNGTSPAKEIKFPINSVDIENQIGEETKTRARTIKGSETNILFSDIAGMDAYISGNSVTITVKEGTSMKEDVKKHTALRARMGTGKDGFDFEKHCLRDERLIEEFSLDAQKRILSLFSGSYVGTEIALFLSNKEKEDLEGLIQEYIFQWVLYRFYQMIGEDSKAYESSVDQLVKFIELYTLRQVAGKFEDLRKKWISETIGLFIAAFSRYNAVYSGNEITITSYLESGDQQQVQNLCISYIKNSVAGRFYEILLLDKVAEEYHLRAKEAVVSADNILKRQRRYSDNTLFNSLLSVSIGDTDLMFSEMLSSGRLRSKMNNLRSMYISSVTNRILNKFYTSLGMSDVALSYLNDVNSIKAAIKDMASSESASYTVVQGRLSDSIRQVMSFLAPVQNNLPYKPYEETPETIKFYLMRSVLPLTYSGIYGIKDLTENFLVYNSVAGWMSFCGLGGDFDIQRLRDTEKDLKEAINRRIKFVDMFLQLSRDGADMVNSNIFSWYRVPDGYYFDDTRLQVNYSIDCGYNRKDAIEKDIYSAIKSYALYMWYSKFGDDQARINLEKFTDMISRIKTKLIEIEPFYTRKYETML